MTSPCHRDTVIPQQYGLLDHQSSSSVERDHHGNRTQRRLRPSGVCAASDTGTGRSLGSGLAGIGVRVAWFGSRNRNIDARLRSGGPVRLDPLGGSRSGSDCGADGLGSRNSRDGRAARVRTPRVSGGSRDVASGDVDLLGGGGRRNRDRGALARSAAEGWIDSNNTGHCQSSNGGSGNDWLISHQRDRAGVSSVRADVGHSRCGPSLSVGASHSKKAAHGTAASVGRRSNASKISLAAAMLTLVLCAQGRAGQFDSKALADQLCQRLAQSSGLDEALSSRSQAVIHSVVDAAVLDEDRLSHAADDFRYALEARLSPFDWLGELTEDSRAGFLEALPLSLHRMIQLPPLSAADRERHQVAVAWLEALIAASTSIALADAAPVLQAAAQTQIEQHLRRCRQSLGNCFVPSQMAPIPPSALIDDAEMQVSRFALSRLGHTLKFWQDHLPERDQAGFLPGVVSRATSGAVSSSFAALLQRRESGSVARFTLAGQVLPHPTGRVGDSTGAVADDSTGLSVEGALAMNGRNALSALAAVLNERAGAGSTIRTCHLRVLVPESFTRVP